jgi:hypothetical protein
MTCSFTGPDDDLHQVLEDQRDADRGDQRGHTRGAAEGPVGEPLDGHVDRAHHGHADGQGRDEDRAKDERLRDRAVGQVQPEEVERGREARQEEQADERSDHEHVAVGEVDQLDDPVDHRIAEGDEGIDRAEHERVADLLGAGRDGLRKCVLDGDRVGRAQVRNVLEEQQDPEVDDDPDDAADEQPGPEREPALRDWGGRNCGHDGPLRSA